MKKTLITYVYFERDKKHYRKRDAWRADGLQDNLRFFLRHGLVDNDRYHYNFMINNHVCSVEIPESENISVIRRDNVGYDFGAYSASIRSVNLDEYDNFIFINDTMRGPFIPTYIPSKISWVDMFLDKLDDKVVMVGPVLNRGRVIHIQSSCFGLSRVGLDACIEAKIFRDPVDYVTTGWKWKKFYKKDYEVGMTDLFFKTPGMEIKSFIMSGYEELDRRPRKYENPLEVMFIKWVLAVGWQYGNTQTREFAENYTKWMGL